MSGGYGSRSDHLAVAHDQGADSQACTLWPAQEGGDGLQVGHRGGDVRGGTVEQTVQQRYALPAGNIHPNLDQFGVKAVVTTATIGGQLAVVILAFQVDGGGIPMQDAEVDPFLLHHPSRDGDPGTSQEGMQFIQSTPKALVVQLLGLQPKHRSHDRLGGPLPDVAEGLGSHEPVEGQNFHQAAQIDVGFGPAQAIDRLSHLHGFQQRVEDRDGPDLTGR